MQFTLSPADSISLGSAIVATAALGFTIYQAVLTRRHNRLSVTPHLSSSTNANWTDQGLVLRLAIHSTGIGPARITGRRVYLDGAPVNTNVNALENEVARVVGNVFKCRINRVGIPGEASSFPVGSEFCVLELLVESIGKVQRETVDALLARFRLEIDYESFYGDKFRFNFKDDAISPT